MKNQTEKRTETLMIRITKEEKKKIENLSNKLNISMSEIVRNMLKVGYDDEVLFDKLKILEKTQQAIDLTNKLKKILKEINK